MFWKEQFHLLHKTKNPQERKVLLIEFYPDVGADVETKKTAKMPLNKTCNNNPIVLLQNLGFACVMLGLPGISRPHWDLDEQGFSIFQEHLSSRQVSFFWIQLMRRLWIYEEDLFCRNMSSGKLEFAVVVDVQIVHQF